ncbi:serine hydrolase domain-containing protein [Enhygromyxa salina]|uniref:Putative penicillin-binding protein PbpX n=1 Tax=Enhygromyxa salina TaxID=215803 RepID=A0A2S9YDL8_9BACT|nr:serine hydrolase domain-containing protein [Enhygromyxa salina]PRQ03204.1 putative penicillin-binding protein PbpX [Enhygromyxa salina]
MAEQRLGDPDALDMPGVAYAVVEQGEITEIGAAGVKRLGSDEPIVPETPFVIGSISKSFTAVAVMQLAEAGKLSLDDPISRHLPAFADKPSGAITIRRLLSHTSGFSTFQGHVSGPALSLEKGPIARRAAQLATMDPAYEPGQVWEYSNANYQILGRLIEVVSEQPFPDYIETHILEPIGMDHSFVSDGEIHAAMATGHRPWFWTKRPLEDNRTDLGTAPQGGVVSSASDLARYMAVMMNGETDIISARAKTAMMQPASDTSPFYGLGWFLDPEDGTAWHSGASPGVETLLTMLPKEKKGVVVLVNAASGIGFGETAALQNGITTSALGLDYEGEPSRWVQKATFIFLVLLPLVFLLSIVWAWSHRDDLRAKSGLFGMFSLWFPLLTTLGSALVLVVIVPRLFGVPMATLRVFQPDLALAMIAAAITGVLWALVRLGLAYTGKAADA